MSRYLVTSALPYANGPLHLGHLAGAYLPADIYVRFLRMQDEDVLYICGTDEHGVPITITAEKMGLTPRQVVDEYHGVIAEDFRRMGISFDNFSRTETEEHYRYAQEVFLDLLAKDYIVEKPMKQFHCASCDRFLPDRYVGGTCPKCHTDGARGDQCESCGSWLDAQELENPICALCGAVPELKETRHWFLRLDRFQDWLTGWLGGHPDWRPNVLNYCGGWLKEGLRERAITRDLDWGVPVPLDGAEGKVLYVWFEALLGYVSSTMEYFAGKGEPERWKDYWKDPATRLVHFIGKDNIVFHAVIEPAILHGLDGYVLPWNIPANEYLNIAGVKFSTSRGTAIWMKDYLEHMPPDPLRYALAANAPENRDTDFSWEEFRVRNNELADVFGNFLNRTLKFTQTFFGGRVPEGGEPGESELELMASALETRDRVAEMIRGFRLKAACAEIMDLARAGNRYFDRVQPWKTAKEDADKCAVSIRTCLQLADTLRILFSPFLPFSCAEATGMLGRKDTVWSQAGTSTFEPGHPLGEPAILFTKLKKGFEKIFEAPVESAEVKPDRVDEKPRIPFDRFMEMDMRVGIIRETHDIEGADKLYRLMVDMGDHTRQLVAGMKPYYAPEELVGRKVVVVTNLEPAKIRGVTSDGMLLASDGPGGVHLLMPTGGAEPGDRIR